MKAILCSQYCQPDDLVLADVPDPVAEAGQAVIAIKAAALNFFDILMIQGKYQIKPPFPFSPAAEVAGVIESVGAGVTDLKVGDRVVASCGHNGAREKIALPANTIVKIPDNLDFDRAAGIIIIYGTALHALEDRASPKPGETLAVLGAAGGTGLAACELGKLMGLKVIACASSDVKLEFAKAHGAEIFTELTVSHIAKEGRHWRVHFAPTEEPDAPLRSVEAKTVVLSAGTLGSTEILLRSREEGLPLSDRLGERFSANGDIIAFALGGKGRVNGIGVGYPPKFVGDAIGACVTGEIELNDDGRLDHSMFIQEGVLPSALAPRRIAQRLLTRASAGPNGRCVHSKPIAARRPAISPWHPPSSGVTERRAISCSASSMVASVILNRLLSS